MSAAASLHLTLLPLPGLVRVERRQHRDDRGVFARLFCVQELAEAGLSVVLLERGGWVNYDEHNDDELWSQRTPALGNPFGPDDQRYRRVIANADGSTRIVLPSEGSYNNVAACVGSGTVSYGAMAWRFMPQDFRLRSTYGDVAGSTLADWPISYEDLEPFYEKAEYEIGVAGDYTADGAASFPGSDASQFRALQRPAGLHPHALLRWFCLPHQCQGRHPQHGHPGGLGDGQLRAAHRLRGFGNRGG